MQSHSISRLLSLPAFHPSQRQCAEPVHTLLRRSATGAVRLLLTLFLIWNSPNFIGAQSVVSWGLNNNGQLGDGTQTSSLTPIPVLDLTDVRSISAGTSHSLALKTDGTVWAWGGNGSGQLGDGTTTRRLTPGQVSTLTDVQAITSGVSHNLALKTDGTVWAWGANNFGMLGDGTTTNRSTPVQVSSLTDVAAISATSLHSLALKTDGTVWAWGSNINGQLGDGTTTNRSTPVQVSSLTDIVAISAGGSHSLALKTDGTVWAWGRNNIGQLGDGTTTSSLTPVQTIGLTDVQAISAGVGHSLALKTDGTVWAWGTNSVGELGNGTFTPSSTPVQVSGLTDVTTITAGSAHSMAIRTDRTVWTWGFNSRGQLGDGTMNNRPVPVVVLGVGGVDVLTASLAVAGGGGHSLAVRNIAPVANADAYNTDEDTPLVVNAPGVLDNDGDADTSTLTVELVDSPGNGSLTLSPDGSFTYTPFANFHGTDQFTYRAFDGTDYSEPVTVTLNVVSINDAPVAVNDSASTSKNTPVQVLVLANDTDVDGDTLTVSAVTNGALGTVAISPNGTTVTYTPNPGATGQDTFTYTVSDGQGGFATASVTVYIETSPKIDSLTPDTVTVGSSDVVIDIVGENFVPGSQVRLEGMNLSTTYVNSQLLRAVVPASVLAQTGEYKVTVYNPNSNKHSNFVKFYVVNP